MRMGEVRGLLAWFAIALGAAVGGESYSKGKSNSSPALLFQRREKSSSFAAFLFQRREESSSFAAFLFRRREESYLPALFQRTKRSGAPGTKALACLFLAAVLGCLPSLAVSAPRIGVVTMQPGEIFWERFGHDAIVVDDPDAGPPVSYNFGYFDLTEPGFIGRFVRGEMEYQLVALPLDEDLAYYRDTGRGVSIQWLDLDAPEAMRLAAALAENAKPENARYRYDYFTDNCATRVRDALDDALGGLLRQRLQPRSQGNTYRSEAVRLASPAGWMWLGFDVGLGPFADVPRSRWEDAFVPMHLADGLRDTRRADGRALVASEEQLLPHRIAPEPVARPRQWLPWLAAGLLLAGMALAVSRELPRRALWLGLPLWVACAVLGALMVYLWGFTAHRAGWANHNLLLLNPLCALLLPGAVRLLRGRDPGGAFRMLLLVVLCLAVLALFLLWLPLQPQRNAPWIALLLPLHVALWWRLGRPALARAPVAAHDAGHG
jgi:hypothetical protein